MLDFNQLMRSRRAVSFFDPNHELQDELLRTIIETAAQAPSSFNLQPWNVIVVKDAAAKMRLRKVAMDQPKVTEAPVVLIVLADRNNWRGGHPVVEKNFNQLVASGYFNEKERLYPPKWRKSFDDIVVSFG